MASASCGLHIDVEAAAQAALPQPPHGAVRPQARMLFVPRQQGAELLKAVTGSVTPKLARRLAGDGLVSTLMEVSCQALLQGRTFGQCLSCIRCLVVAHQFVVMQRQYVIAF